MIEVAKRALPGRTAFPPNHRRRKPPVFIIPMWHLPAEKRRDIQIRER